MLVPSISLTSSPALYNFLRTFSTCTPLLWLTSQGLLLLYYTVYSGAQTCGVEFQYDDPEEETKDGNNATENDNKDKSPDDENTQAKSSRSEEDPNEETDEEEANQTEVNIDEESNSRKSTGSTNFTNSQTNTQGTQARNYPNEVNFAILVKPFESKVEFVSERGR